MEIIQEDTVRQLLLRQGITELHITRDTYVTDQARDYIRQNGIRLISEPDAPAAAGDLPLNDGIRPAQEMRSGRFVTLDGRRLDSKPEHMTHLHGNVLVEKTHPRIVLRGKLDSLQASILSVQLKASDRGDARLVAALQETLDLARSLMAAEVTDKPLGEVELLGMDEAAQRRVSHNPKKYLGVGHLMPDIRMGAVALGLNELRCEAREVELACIAAFAAEDGSCEREDLVRALNRLSSTFYIMMLGVAAGICQEDSEHERTGAL